MNSEVRILAIDDDPTALRLYQSGLGAQGYTVIIASDGDEGLQQYITYQPDIIILDILMPRMDGYSFVLEFKKIGSIRKTPIIVVTSRDSMQDIFEVEGINDYIVKPFQMTHLVNKVNKHLQDKTKKILLVDDEEDIVDVMGNRLQAGGYDILKAYDGLQGLEMAKQERPDLVVLDILMPKMNGLNVCRMLKYDEEFKNISVILLTALNQKKDHLIGEEVGADAYLPKPYDGLKLMHTVKELLWD